MALTIRPCTEHDRLVLSEREPAQRGFAAQAYRNQVEGRTTFLTAWSEAVPVGSCEVTAGPHPEVVNLNVGADHRGRGIGTALFEASERLVFTWRELTIGVGVDNTAAARLYLRLGYRRTGQISTTSYTFVDDDGVPRHAVETDEALIKRW